MEKELAYTQPVSDRLIAGWEIVSVISSFLMAEWIIRPFGSRDKLVAAIPLGIALIVIILSHYARGETLRSLGWRFDNFWQAIRFLALPTLCMAAVIISAGWAIKGFGSNKWREWQWVAWLPLWALVQQYALQGFINRRAQIVFGTGYKSILAVAVVFAMLHLPNPWLTVGTFIGGGVWAATYQRFPNLFALSLCHGLMSWLLVLALPGSVLGGLRVGLRYFV
jgi:membrane protease YdiL (CAAX protease family)